MTDVSETDIAAPPQPARRAIWVAAVVVVLAMIAVGIGVFVADHDRASAADHLTDLFAGRGENTRCVRAGVMAFAGGRSTVYRCSWVSFDRYRYATTHRKCAVWEDGAGYDVTKQARAAAQLTGDRSIC